MNIEALWYARGRVDAGGGRLDPAWFAEHFAALTNGFDIPTAYNIAASKVAR